MDPWAVYRYESVLGSEMMISEGELVVSGGAPYPCVRMKSRVRLKGGNSGYMYEMDFGLTAWEIKREETK